MSVCYQFSFSFYLLWLFLCVDLEIQLLLGKEIRLERDDFLLQEKRKKEEKNQSQNDSACLSCEDFQLKFDCGLGARASTWVSLDSLPENLMDFLSIFRENFWTVNNSSFRSF